MCSQLVPDRGWLFCHESHLTHVNAAASEQQSIATHRINHGITTQQSKRYRPTKYKPNCRFHRVACGHCLNGKDKRRLHIYIRPTSSTINRCTRREASCSFVIRRTATSRVVSARVSCAHCNLLLYLVAGVRLTKPV